MKGTVVLLVGIVVTSWIVVEGAQKKSSRCNIPLIAPKNIAKTIQQCQEDIKNALLTEAAQLIDVDALEENSKIPIITRQKRDIFSSDERRIAGCLLQCVYRKRNAVNGSGFPTTEGLVSLFAEGVKDQDYVLATHQAVHRCLTAAHQKYIITPQSLSENGKTCDVAFDTFDCISDRIGEYCGQTP